MNILMPVGPALMLFQKLASMFAVVSSLNCCHTAAMQSPIMQWLNVIKVLSLELIKRVNRDSSGGPLSDNNCVSGLQTM